MARKNPRRKASQQNKRKQARMQASRQIPRKPYPIRATAAPGSLTIASDADDDVKSCHIVAYTGGFLNLPNYKLPVVVDLDSLRVPERPVMLLKNHDQDQPVGHVTACRVEDNQLLADGLLSAATDAAEEIVTSARRGFPWGASIGADPESLEPVAAGATVTINGQTLTGPFLVARNTELREITFCPCGVDSSAYATVAAQYDIQGEDVMMTLEQWAESLGIDLTQLDDAAVAALEIAFNSLQEPITAEEEEPEIEAAEEPAAPVEEEKAAEPVAASRPAIATPKQKLQALRDRTPRAPAGHHAAPKQHASRTIEAALCLSGGLDEDAIVNDYGERTVEAARKDYRGCSIKQLMIESARASGQTINPFGFGDSHIRAALETARYNPGIQASGGFSTLSVSGILANVANKALMNSFDSHKETATTLCDDDTAPDFKQKTLARFTLGGGLQLVGPAGEIQDVDADDETYNTQVKTRAAMITLTREMIINDDLGAFLKIPKLFGRKSKLSLDEVFYTLLLANTDSFFASGNGNLVATASTEALSIDGLTAAEVLLETQTDKVGDAIAPEGKYLVVPPQLKNTAHVLMTSTHVNEAATAGSPAPDVNPHSGKYEIVSSPFLQNSGITGYSTTAWYLFADPKALPAFTITYLNGQKSPTIENAEVDFAKLGMSWRCVFDFGVDQTDPRGAVMSDGAD